MLESLVLVVDIVPVIVVGVFVFGIFIVDVTVNHVDIHLGVLLIPDFDSASWFMKALRTVLYKISARKHSKRWDSVEATLRNLLWGMVESNFQKLSEVCESICH